jgi:hypothetical protein
VTPARLSGAIADERLVPANLSIGIHILHT